MGKTTREREREREIGIEAVYIGCYGYGSMHAATAFNFQ